MEESPGSGALTQEQIDKLSASFGVAPEEGISQAQLDSAFGIGPSQATQPDSMPRTQVRPVMLQSFDEPAPAHAQPANFMLIQDVPLEISVEVGRARKLVREIIEFSEGTIVELDKQAGDPVDVIVNGQMIARGEIVVIDENFGVRITEILDKKPSLR
jgi:flagellar motor switch protein FliN/FliY